MLARNCNGFLQGNAPYDRAYLQHLLVSNATIVLFSFREAKVLNLTHEKSLSCGFASLVLHSVSEWHSSKEYIIAAADHSK